MPLKISFNNQTHKISKLPENFHDLKNLTQVIFNTQLPEDWTLQYLDTEGDLIMLSDEHDYVNLKDELASSNSSIKISVVSVEHLNKRENEDYQVLEKEESEHSQTELIKEEEVQQQQEEEQQPVEVIPPSSLSEVSPSQEVELPKTEEVKTEETEQKDCQGKFRHYQVKRILKRLSKANLTQQEREKLEGVLNALQETLTEEQKKELQNKRERISKNQAEKLQRRKDELSEVVTDMIYAHLPTIASFTKEFIEDKQNPFAPKVQTSSQERPSQVVHHRIICDGCRASPIVGIRYKCTVCPDFDFCENCEETVEHAHPFIKFKKPQESPRRHGGFPLLFGFPPHGGRQRWGNREGCPMNGERRCPFKQSEQKPDCQQKEKMNEPEGKEFKGLEGLGGLLGSLFSGIPVATEQTGDLLKLFSGVQKKVEEGASQYYQAMPEELRKEMNEMLGGLPDKIFQKKTESKSEEKNEEVKIEEIPIPKAQTQESENGPLIQEIVIEKEKEEEPKKQYPQDVVEKAKKLREIFVEASVEDLCEFVVKVPQLSLEELVDNFLSNL